jgi:hypothetical protein
MFQPLDDPLKNLVDALPYDIQKSHLETSFERGFIG